MSEYHQLAKNTVWVALGNLGSKFIIFLMVPLYTHILSPTQYGLIDFLQISTYLFGLFFSLQMVEAVFRYCNGKDAHEQRIIFTNGLFVILLALLIFIALTPFLKFFGSYSQYLPYFIAVVILNVFLEYIKAFTRAQNLMWRIASGDILYTLIFTGLNIYLMVFLKMAIAGFLLSLMTAQFVTIVYLALTAKAHRFILPSTIGRAACKKMIYFSLPLIPYTISGFLISYIDRYLLISMLGLAAAGLYTVANKVPTVLMMFNAMFNQSWTISGLKQYESSTLSVAEKQVFYTNVFEYNTNAFMVIISMLLLVIKPSFHFMIDSRFNHAWVYAPALLFGGLFLALNNYLSVIYMAAQKTKMLLYSNLGGVGLNILLNLLLIPSMGIQGASVATVAAYVLIFIWLFKDSGKLLKITLKRKTLYLFLLLLAQTFCLYQRLDLLQGIIFLVILGYNKQLLLSAYHYVSSTVQSKLGKKPYPTHKISEKVAYEP